MIGISRAVSNVFVVSAKRTPFGSYGKSLRNLSARELIEISSSAALKAGNVDPSLVTSVIFGLIHACPEDTYLARNVSLRCGTPHTTPAYNIGKLSGSSMQTVINASHEIELGESQVALVGGVESYSKAPYLLNNARFGTTLGDLKLQDYITMCFSDPYLDMEISSTVEDLAERHGITREQSDKYALQSLQRWAKANEDGVLKAEIVPVEIKTRNGMQLFEIDEPPIKVTENLPFQLAAAKSTFKTNGVVTAENTSKLADGVAFIILANDETVLKHNLQPMARLVSYGTVGVAPMDTGYGPVPACQLALKSAGLTVKDIDICEINETYAAQYLTVEKALGLNREVTNMNGGAIAIGYPNGASGARIIGHLAHELNRQNKRYAMGGMCIAGGQGISVILERA